MIKPHVFPVYNKQRKMNIGWRKQIPLNLAYGITVHRAQGMTLDKVVVDCRNMTIPGQIGVALGRATSIAGLQVLNFKTSLLKTHPKEIDQFYTQENIPVDPTRNCCQKTC